MARHPRQPDLLEACCSLLWSAALSVKVVGRLGSHGYPSALLAASHPACDYVPFCLLPADAWDRRGQARPCYNIAP